MKKALDVVAKEHLDKKNLPDFRAGDTVRITVKVKEGDVERVQYFEGPVIRKRGTSTGATFTARKVSFGVGVERTFPLYSPNIENIKVISHGKVSRARLYYLRSLSGKVSKIERKETAQTSGYEKSKEPATLPV